MKIDVATLPNDVEQLKEKVVDLSTELHNKEIELQEWEEKYKVLKDRLFGKSSEKLSDTGTGQQLLFNEAEEGYDPEQVVQPDDEEKIKITYERKKRGRKPVPINLPRRRVEHDLPDAKKQCPCCHADRPRIGEKVSTEVEFLPATLEAIEHVYPVYGACNCEAFKASEEPEVIQAPAIRRILPGSIAGPGLLTQIIISKYEDALPFYRQEKIFKRLGIDISRTSMCNWFIHSSENCADVLDLLWDDCLQSSFIQMDETPVQVLKEPGRPATKKSYMWIAIGYPENKPIILFHYHASRSGDIPLEILKDYNGFLQTDGYSGYNAAGSLPGIIHVGCFAHVRRKFVEAAKATKNPANAHIALSHIRKLYRIEDELRKQELQPDDFVRQRKEKALPVLTEFNEWLIEKSEEVTPQSLLGKAINYALSEWIKLVRYLESWECTPDNNRPENAIRPFVVGRKNWLFSDTPRGAHASATFYSLVETAKANGLDPFKYLHFLFTRLPYAETPEEKRALLPHRVSAEDLEPSPPQRE